MRSGGDVAGFGRQRPPCCHHDRSSNACLTLDWGSTLEWLDAHVGFDVYMPEQYATEVLACYPGGPDFRASLWGDDGRRGADPSDDHIRDLQVEAVWPIAEPTGISAEFIGPGLNVSELDEDDGEDQIYARGSFYDCHTGARRDFTTGYSLQLC